MVIHVLNFLFLDDLDVAEDWFSEKITEYDSYTDTVMWELITTRLAVDF